MLNSVKLLSSGERLGMGVKERRARQKRFLRQEILDAASQLFVRDGFENVSMRRIADRIEYSPTTIYLYFKDKAELLEQVCAETFAGLLQRLHRINELHHEPMERLRRGLLAYIEFGAENPHHYRATFMMPFPAEAHREHQERPDSPGMQAFDFLRRAVHEGVASGKLKINDVELASQTLWAGVHGVTSLAITNEKFRQTGREKVAKAMVDTLLKGLSEERV